MPKNTDVSKSKDIEKEKKMYKALVEKETTFFKDGTVEKVLLIEPVHNCVAWFSIGIPV